jgi:hypothetical protein
MKPVCALAVCCALIGYPAFAQGCFWVHGRLSMYDGTPTLRIWPTGTKRLLGVCEVPCEDTEEGPPLPPNVVFPGKAETMWGDFKVCPLTVSRPGHMRYVRLTKAKHIFVPIGDGN